MARNLKRSTIKMAILLIVIIGGAAFDRERMTAADPTDYLGQTGRHRILSSDMPPGFVGQARLSGRGPVAGYFQPVAFSGPKGVGFSMPQGNEFFTEPVEFFQAGLLIGGVYRFRISGIPGFEGAELYPTVELIDRIYPPPGLETRYPVVINLDDDDLISAMNGRMVTRVVYLEDPTTAIALAESPRTSRVMELSEHQDALEVADRMGRPVAIVRIGTVAPPNSPALMPHFFFGYPAWAPIYQPENFEQVDPTAVKQ